MFESDTLLSPINEFLYYLFVMADSCNPKLESVTIPEVDELGWYTLWLFPCLTCTGFMTSSFSSSVSRSGCVSLSESLSLSYSLIALAPTAIMSESTKLDMFAFWTGSSDWPAPIPGVIMLSMFLLRG